MRPRYERSESCYTCIEEDELSGTNDRGFAEKQEGQRVKVGKHTGEEEKESVFIHVGV